MVLSGLAFFKGVSVLHAESSDGLFRFCGTFAGSAGFVCFLVLRVVDIEVTSWLVSADDFSSRVARGANERVSAANE